MRSDKYKNKSDQEREMDEFFSQFESDDAQTDVESYLDTDVEELASYEAEPLSKSENSSANTKAAKKEAKRQEKAAQKEAKKEAKLAKKAAKKEAKATSASDATAAATTTESFSNDKKTGKMAKLKTKLSNLARTLFLVENPDYDPDAGEYILKENGKKKKNKPYKISLKKVLKDAIVVVAVIILIFIIYAFIVIATADSIDPSDIYATISQSSIIYDEDGNEVDTVYYSQNRTLVEYDDLPEDLINAFVAIEDKTFWTHNGFNWTRIIGAVFESIIGGGNISGTSTITQQLARNVYLADIKSERSIRRKLLEMYYTVKIEHTLSKEEIITAYLNTIYLGYGTYGVQSAAQAYFSKDVSELTLIECAALAALPQSPSSYALVFIASSSTDLTTSYFTVIDSSTSDTYVANDLSKTRRNTTLTLMLNQEYITQEEYDEVYDTDLIDFIDPYMSTEIDANAYFTDYLIEQVISDLMDEYDYTYTEAETLVYTGGLVINSTLDSTAQAVITEEFSDSSNFPTLTGLTQDSDGNVLDSSGSIAAYDYNDYFDDDGNFVFTDEEVEINDDGSITIMSGYRLNIYTTSTSSGTDYSLEFKDLALVNSSSEVYFYDGGYINISSTYKSLDDDGNLIISAEYFEDYPDAILIEDGTVTITSSAYTLSAKTIQPQAAMVIVEVGTGELKAMVGGRDLTGRQLLNRATSTRQPGSSIKPLSVYSAALQLSYELAEAGETMTYVDYGHDTQGTEGYGDYLTASSIIKDEPLTFDGEIWPKNSGGGYSGNVTMRYALQQSINTVAVKLLLQIGVDYSVDLVQKYGITTLVTDSSSSTNDLNLASMALGGLTNGVQPLEMAAAYATFPNGGVYQSVICYTTVEDRDGNVLLTAESESTEVLNEGVAWIMTNMLQSVVSSGLGTNAAISGESVGGKTGTTSDQYDIWFCGFTANYAAALWIGADINIKLSSMSGTAAKLWGTIMKQIPNALGGTYKSMPDNVVYKDGEYYTEGTETGLSGELTEEEIEELEEQASDLESQISSLQSEINSLKTEISTIEATISALESALTSAETDEEKEKIQTQIDEYESELSSLQSSLSSKQSELSSLQSELEELQAQLE